MSRCRTVFLSALVFCCCFRLNAQTEEQDKKMQWWRDAHFGMFIHWGVYSQYGGVWQKDNKRYTEFIMLQARIPLKEYAATAALFNPVDFDAESWVLTAKNAGMKYLVYTAKHHEGFAMYRSSCSHYSICEVTPFKRDPLEELEKACRKHGLKLGIYYSLGRDWEDPDTPTNWPTKGGRSNTWDYPDEDAKDFSRYLERKARPQIMELLTQYHPDILWFDTPEEITSEQSAELRRMILEQQPNVLINQRIGNGQGDFLVLEQKQSDRIIPGAWESCVTLSRNWGYVKADREFKEPAKVVSILVDIVSKGGNLLLNAGPTEIGVFRPENLEQLKAVGQWMKTNGEAIYATRPWTVYGEDLSQQRQAEEREFNDTEFDATEERVQDIRFTSKGEKVLYVIARNWLDATIRVNTLTERQHAVASVKALGYKGKVSWKQTCEGLSIVLPDKMVDKDMPIYTFKVVLK